MHPPMKEITTNAFRQIPTVSTYLVLSQQVFRERQAAGPVQVLRLVDASSMEVGTAPA